MRLLLYQFRAMLKIYGDFRIHCWLLLSSFIIKIASHGWWCPVGVVVKLWGILRVLWHAYSVSPGQVYDGYRWWGTGQSYLLSECAAAKADGTECYIYLQWSVRAEDVDNIHFCSPDGILEVYFMMICLQADFTRQNAWFLSLNALPFLEKPKAYKSPKNTCLFLVLFELPHR